MNQNAECGAWACETLRAECPVASNFSLSLNFTQGQMINCAIPDFDNLEFRASQNLACARVKNGSFNAISAHTEM